MRAVGGKEVRFVDFALFISALFSPFEIALNGRQRRCSILAHSFLFFDNNFVVDVVVVYFSSSFEPRPEWAILGRDQVTFLHRLDLGAVRDSAQVVFVVCERRRRRRWRSPLRRGRFLHIDGGERQSGRQEAFFRPAASVSAATSTAVVHLLRCVHLLLRRYRSIVRYRHIGGIRGSPCDRRFLDIASCVL